MKMLYLFIFMAIVNTEGVNNTNLYSGGRYFGTTKDKGRKHQEKDN